MEANVVRVVIRRTRIALKGYKHAFFDKTYSSWALYVRIEGKGVSYFLR